MKANLSLTLVLAVTALLMTGAPVARATVTTPAPPASLRVAPTELTPGTETELPLLLHNDTPCGGLQADVRLPEGLHPVLDEAGKPMVTPCGRASGYTAVSNLLDDGTIRLGLFSLNHTPISPSEEASETEASTPILTIRIMTTDGFGGGDATLTGILLTDVDDRDVELPDATTRLTVAPKEGNGTLAIVPVSVEPGTGTELPLLLHNDTPCGGLQADVRLPAGLHPVLDEEGKPTVTPCGRAIGYTAVSNLLPDGTIRLGLFSLSHTPISPSDSDEGGETPGDPILKIRVRATDDFRGGYATLTGILLADEDDRDTRLPDTTTEIGVYVPTNTFAPEPLEIARGESMEESMDRMDEEEKMGNVEEGDGEPGKDGDELATPVLGFILDNETPFSAFQSDIYLPAGLHADPGSARLTARGGDGHEVTARCYPREDGGTMLRVVCFSPQGHSFSGETGILLTVAVTADKTLADHSEVRTSNTIFSTSGGREYRLADSQAEVTAYDPEEPFIPVTGITLLEHEVTLDPGEEFRLGVEILPEGATDRSVTWESGDETIATVGEDGTVKARTPGKTVVTVRTADGSDLYDSCEVTVRDFETGAETPATTPMRISRDNGMMTVSGVAEREEAILYTLDGIELMREGAKDGEIRIRVIPGQPLLLRIGTTVHKLM